MSRTLNRVRDRIRRRRFVLVDGLAALPLTPAGAAYKQLAYYGSSCGP